MLPIITIARQYGSGGHEVGERQMCIRDRDEHHILRVLAVGKALQMTLRGACRVHDALELEGGDDTVSYTHLDVYKRQAPALSASIAAEAPAPPPPMMSTSVS